MEDCKKLGGLFGEKRVWSDDYLPCSNRRNMQEGVLQEILNNPEYEKDIPSLRRYKEDYPDFCKAYYDNLPKNGFEHSEDYWTCVPYWGSDYWKSNRRIAIFAQKSLNRDGAGIPLYFPLCEIKSWERAFELGCRLNEKQRSKPFSWQSFMSVWIATRYIFSGETEHLQQVYYSDMEKLRDKERSVDILIEELEIIKPGFTILFGKTSYKTYKPLFTNSRAGKVSYIYFPCGQGTLHSDVESLKRLEECKNDLSKWLNR